MSRSMAAVSPASKDGLASGVGWRAPGGSRTLGPRAGRQDEQGEQQEPGAHSDSLPVLRNGKNSEMPALMARMFWMAPLFVPAGWST